MPIKYGIKKLGLFGSVARGEQGEGSDVDIYMDSEPQSLFTMAHLKEELQELLGCRVDIVRLREHMNLLLRKKIEKEGFYVKAEHHTSQGRIDLVLQTDKYIYVMEFKLDGTAEDALQQINDKHYARPFEAEGRQLFKIGVNFSNATRNIEHWMVEE